MTSTFVRSESASPESVPFRTTAAIVPLGKLVLALACTFLPVVLTSRLAPVFRTANVEVPTWLSGPAFIFTVYAACNVIALGVLLVVLGRDRLRRLGAGLRFSWRKTTLAFVAFVLGVALFGIVAVALRQLGMPTLRGMPVELGAIQAVILLLTVALAVPYVEEILFRVVWYGGLEPRIGAWPAGALATAAFAAIHLPYFGVGGVIFIAFWSLLPLFLFVRTGDITASWLMHAFNNAFAYVVVPLYDIRPP